jgi:hypothetical protein
MTLLVGALIGWQAYEHLYGLFFFQNDKININEMPKNYTELESITIGRQF